MSRICRCNPSEFLDASMECLVVVRNRPSNPIAPPFVSQGTSSFHRPGSSSRDEYPSCCIAGRSAGEDPWKPESREYTWIESRYGADLVAGKSDDKQTKCVLDVGKRIAQIHAICRLAVRPGRDEPIATALPKGNGREEASGKLAALVFQRYRRHTNPDVVRHEGDNPVDVAVFVGSDEPAQDFLLGRRVCSRRRLVRDRHFSG